MQTTQTIQHSRHDTTRALHGSPMGDPFKMGTHWVYCKYLFSNQMLSDKKHITWKLVNFCIDSNKQLCHIEDASGNFGSFLINPQLECFEISLIFHGLLLWLQKKTEMKIFLNWSQESLEKNSWVPIAMLWTQHKPTHRRRTIHFHETQQQTIVLKTHYLLWAFVKQTALLNLQYISRCEPNPEPFDCESDAFPTDLLKTWIKVSFTNFYHKKRKKYKNILKMHFYSLSYGNEFGLGR